IWRLFLAGAGVLLAGCGFHPLYGSPGDGTAGPAEAGLSQISVGLIPERGGQLLGRRCRRVSSAGVAAPRRAMTLPLPTAWPATPWQFRRIVRYPVCGWSV